jgi:PAS domain S-box-containing protein
MSPQSKRSHSASPFRLTMPYISPGQLAFSAMQFLPVPLLVLNNFKTVVLANEAMGKLLGLPFDPGNQPDSCALDQLRGQTLSQVGIDMIQDGRPVWISWDDLFDSLVVDGEEEQEAARRQSVVVKLPDELTTPKAASSETLAISENGTERATVSQPCSNSVIEVVVSTKAYNSTTAPTKNAEHQVLAKMIITVFEVEENQRFFTLTFTNTESPAALQPPRRPVPRSSATVLEAADKKTISYSNPPSVGSSHSSNSPSFRVSPSSVSLSSSPFPPMGPPSRSSTTNTPSLFQKMTTIKDALLDNTQMPILSLWKDGSAPVMNAAARDLFIDPNAITHPDHMGMDILSAWEVYDDEFTRRYEPSEFPIAVLLRTGVPFTGMRVGIIHKRENRKIIFDVIGEIIKDPVTGEMLAGVVTYRDVTDMAQEITTIKEQDEERFKLICDTMPQMVWTTTPDGMYDFFNSRWYDYTGLAPEESLGLGWKNPFHPDDMPAAIRRWKHSLETGDPYMTEYRCLSNEGEWRWMLGRALPLRNKQTGKIEKWFGTCTDVHESLETKAAARRMRQQLLSVLSHVQTSIFSVDRDRKVTMIEGAILWNSRKDNQTPDEESSDDDLYALKYVGRNVDEVFNDLNPRMRQGEILSFLAPIHNMLDGKRRRDVVQEHELGMSSAHHITKFLALTRRSDSQFVRTRFIPTFGKQSHDGLTSESVVDGVIGIIMDVTELKKRELDLQAQAKEKRQLLANEAAAKEASRLKSQFLANVSCRRRVLPESPPN